MALLFSKHWKVPPTGTFLVLWGNPQSPDLMNGGIVMTELLFFLLGLIIGLLSGITILCLYFVKSVSNDRRFELSRLKDEKKNN